DVHGTHTYAEEGTFRIVVSISDAVDHTTNTTASFHLTTLVTDDQAVLTGLGLPAAAHVDPNLKNPWGVSFSPTGSPFWVSDNGAGVSTLYDGSGNPQSLVVTIPVSANPGSTTPAPVTGQVFNGTTSFNISGGPARFIFGTEDGTIAAWNPSLGTNATLV